MKSCVISCSQFNLLSSKVKFSFYIRKKRTLGGGIKKEKDYKKLASMSHRAALMLATPYAIQQRLSLSLSFSSLAIKTCKFFSFKKISSPFLFFYIYKFFPHSTSRFSFIGRCMQISMATLQITYGGTYTGNVVVGAHSFLQKSIPDFPSKY